MDMEIVDIQAFISLVKNKTSQIELRVAEYDDDGLFVVGQYVAGDVGAQVYVPYEDIRRSPDEEADIVSSALARRMGYKLFLKESVGRLIDQSGLSLI